MRQGARRLDRSGLDAEVASLESAVRSLRPERNQARIALLVQRIAENARARPTSLVLDPREGVVGDRWSRGRWPNAETQVTLMRWDVASLMGRDPASFGDNVFASIDTGIANLPPGTVLRLGTARCVVTAKPHRGCSKFEARAGSAALALTRAPAWVAHQLRGVHLRVLDGGLVAVDDEIAVVERPLA